MTDVFTLLSLFIVIGLSVLCVFCCVLWFIFTFDLNFCTTLVFILSFFFVLRFFFVLGFFPIPGLIISINLFVVFGMLPHLVRRFRSWRRRGINHGST